jgi:hypothetical protein
MPTADLPMPGTLPTTIGVRGARNIRLEPEPALNQLVDHRT